MVAWSNEAGMMSRTWRDDRVQLQTSPMDGIDFITIMNDRLTFNKGVHERKGRNWSELVHRKRRKHGSLRLNI